MDTYLNDKAFLQEICAQNNRIVSVRITSYTKDDAPIEVITGKVTSGTINLDGVSSVRRSCSLTLLSDNLNIHDYYWGLKTRIKVEVGLNNTTAQYPDVDIVWFPMGYYLISSFSLQLTTTGLTINISGKDKMCLLNGEMGGIINAPTDFGTEEIIDIDGNVTKKSLPIKTIITEMIHEWGGEDYQNILINDLDEYGLNLQTYRGNDPVYLAIAVDGSNQGNEIFKGDEINSKEVTKIAKNETELDEIIILNSLTADDLYYWNDPLNSTKFKFNHLEEKYNDKEYYIQKIEYGQNIGYTLTELIYAGELKANSGETIVSILDKIKKMLGSYEYFYNLSGNFVFQKQKIYKTTNNLIYKNESETELVNDYLYDDIDLTLNNLNLITNISNSPQFNNIKNDFTIWGNKKGTTGADIPIHMRFAIDNKPINNYTTIRIDTPRKILLQNKYGDRFKNLQLSKAITYSLDGLKKFDWRELIYRMALDWRKLQGTDEYAIWLQEDNPWCINGKTGYEQYYIDLEGFWRTLYQPDWEKISISLTNPSQDFLIDQLVYRILSNGDLQDLQDLWQNYLNKNNISDFSPLQINTQNNEIDLTKQFIKQYLSLEGDCYLYGPLKLMGNTLSRQKYGSFKNIVANNYLILEKYYICKLCALMKKSSLVSEELKKEINQIQDINTLYVYDELTCQEMNIQLTFQDSNDFIELQDYQDTNKEKFYHPLVTDDLNFEVKSYYAWDDRVNKTVKQINSFSLFNTEPKEWFYRVKDKEGNISYVSLGIFYPLSSQDQNNNYELSQDELNNLKCAANSTYFEYYINTFYSNFNWKDINNFRDLIKLGDSLGFDISTKINWIKWFNNIDTDSDITQNIDELNQNYFEYTSNLATYYLTISLLIFFKITDYCLNNLEISNQIINLITIDEQGNENIDINDIDDICDIIFKDWENNKKFQQLFNIQPESLEDNDISINDEDITVIDNIRYFSDKIIFLLEKMTIKRLKEYFKAGLKIFESGYSGAYMEGAVENDGTTSRLPSLSNTSIYQSKKYIKLFKSIVDKVETSKLWKILTQEQKLYYISNESLDMDSTNFSINHFFIDNEKDDEKENIDLENILLLQGNNKLKELQESKALFYQISESLDILEGKITSNNELPTENLFTFIFDYDILNNLHQDYKIKEILNLLNLEFISNNSNSRYIDQNLDLILQIILITLSQIIKNKTLLPSFIASEYSIYQWPLIFDTKTYWNKNVKTNPESLLFWFDISDNNTNPIFAFSNILSSNNLQKYSISNIGRRPIVKTDSAIKAIAYLETVKNILVDDPNNDFYQDYIKTADYKLKNNAYFGNYQFILINDGNQNTLWEDFSDYISLSSQGKSAIEAMENLVYNNGYMTESISISCLPQYFLQPNTRIAIYDNITKINGIYLINKITIPLNHSGVMTISATKDIEKQERGAIFEYDN